MKAVYYVVLLPLSFLPFRADGSTLRQDIHENVLSLTSQSVPKFAGIIGLEPSRPCSCSKRLVRRNYEESSVENTRIASTPRDLSVDAPEGESLGEDSWKLVLSLGEVSPSVAMLSISKP